MLLFWTSVLAVIVALVLMLLAAWLWRKAVDSLRPKQAKTVHKARAKKKIKPKAEEPKTEE